MADRKVGTCFIILLHCSNCFLRILFTPYTCIIINLFMPSVPFAYETFANRIESDQTQ